MAVGMVIASIAIVATFSLFVQWMAGNFGSSPSFTQALELTTYTAAPIFITGIVALIHIAWFIMLARLGGGASWVRVMRTLSVVNEERRRRE